MATLDTSIIVPVYNEEENVQELYRRISAVMDRMKVSYEIIFVDDGSKDGTFHIIEQIEKKDRRVRFIKFRRNFGQTAAVNAGFVNAVGRIIVTMDGDLQNDPEDIPALVSKINEGYDVVSGWRHKRQDGFGKKFFSNISNFIARKITGMELHDFGCSLKAYKRVAVNNLELFGEMHRFVPALLNTQGYKIAEIKVNHHPRIHGKSKYGISRLIKGFLDLLYIKFWSNYSTRPLHLFGFIGILAFAAAVIVFLYKTLSALFIYKIPITADPLLIFSGILVIASIQFLIFGFLGEILIRTYYRNVDVEKRIEKMS